MFDVKHPALFLLGFDEIHRKRQISSHAHPIGKRSRLKSPRRDGDKLQVLLARTHQMRPIQLIDYVLHNFLFLPQSNLLFTLENNTATSGNNQKLQSQYSNF